MPTSIDELNNNLKKSTKIFMEVIEKLSIKKVNKKTNEKKYQFENFLYVI